MPLQEMDIAQTFNVALHVPRLTKPEMMAVLKHLGAFDGPDVSARAGAAAALFAPGMD